MNFLSAFIGSLFLFCLLTSNSFGIHAKDKNLSFPQIVLHYFVKLSIFSITLSSVKFHCQLSNAISLQKQNTLNVVILFHSLSALR